MSARPCDAARCWSIVLPFYNEADWIEPTIQAVLELPRESFRLILVDNASTDGTAELCRRLLANTTGLEMMLVDEPLPGPSRALEAGFAQVTTPFVSFWNADTWYPPDYLARAERMLREKGVVAAMAIGVTAHHDSLRARLYRIRRYGASLVMRRQAHTGTFGQCFRTAELHLAGGPRSAAWPWVLDDHELMHRVLKLGRSRYHYRFLCQTSDRRGADPRVRWTVWERLLYHFTPFLAKDWFFYTFLARRFARRGMTNANLRERGWEATRGQT